MVDPLKPCWLPAELAFQPAPVSLLGSALGQAGPAGGVVDRDPRRRLIVGCGLVAAGGRRDAQALVVGEDVTGAVGAVGCGCWSWDRCRPRPGTASRRAAQHAVLQLEEAEDQGRDGDQDHERPEGCRATAAGAGGARRTGANGTARRAGNRRRPRGALVHGRVGHARRLTGEPVSQILMPRRRAERARWRVARIRRSRLTSIGSRASAAGESIRVLSTW